MADVAVLALGLDTGQMKSGGDQASRVLDDLQRKFEELERRSNALKTNLQGSGTTIKATGQHWQEFGNQARKATDALSGLGGPIGNAAGRVQDLGRQLTELVSTFGVVGSAVTVMGAAVAAAGSAFVALSIQGAKAADELLDVHQATGLSVDQVQRLGAAFSRQGESIKSVESSYRQFQQTVQAALIDKTGEAAQNLRRLGVVAEDAGRDTAKAYIETIAQLKALRASTEGAVASNEVLGRNIGALTRGSSDLQSILSKTRAELQATGIIASDLALGSAAELDTSMSRLNQSFETFKIQLNGIGGGAVNDAFSGLSAILENINGWMTRNEQHPFWKSLVRGAMGGFGPASMMSAATPGGPRREPEVTVGPFSGRGITLRDPIIPEPPRRTTGGGRATPAISPVTGLSELDAINRKVKDSFEAQKKVAEVFYAVQIDDFQTYTEKMRAIDKQFRRDQLLNAEIIGDELSAQLAGLKASGASAESIKRVQDELNKVQEEAIKLGEALGIVVLPEIGKFIERLKDFGKLGLPLTRALDIPATRARTVTTSDRPRVVDQEEFERQVEGRARRAADRERINQEFSFVFEDFIFQIASGRKRIGDAFGDFALGMVDVFASEFARAFQQSLQKAFISPLATWLEDALFEIFSGISGKGIGKFFGGLFKSVFSGFFAEGGTIPANHFGVVGERGPELAFAGSQPMTITPFGSGGGGNSVSVTFHVNAPGGSLDRRSMDQMSEQVLRAVERGTRNRGV